MDKKLVKILVSITYVMISGRFEMIHFTSDKPLFGNVMVFGTKESVSQQENAPCTLRDMIFLAKWTLTQRQLTI